MRPLVLVALLVMAPVAAAQNPSAPSLAPDAPTLYAHGTGSDEFVGFMNTLEDDGDDGAMGSGDALSGSQTWSWTLDPGLARGVTLDGEGTVEITAYVGGSTHIGDVSVSTEITHGGTVVASGEAQDHTITPADAGSGPYGEVTWSLSPEVTELAADAELVWSLTVEGTASAVFVGTGESRGRSNMVLPIASVDSGVEVIFHDVDTQDLTIALELDGTTASHRYNWSMGPNQTVVFAQGNVSAGNLSVAVVDGANETAYEANFTGAVNLTAQFAAAAGAWTVRVDATEATGNVTILFGPPSPSLPGVGDGSDGNGTGDGNATGGSKGSPAWPAVAAAASMFALAAWRRRRM